jgi:hypothetical protein
MADLYYVNYHLGPVTDEERPLVNYIVASCYKEACDKLFNKVKNPEIVAKIECVEYGIILLN